MVIGDGGLGFRLAVYHFGGKHVLLPGVLGEILPDTLLKVGRLHVVDGENGGKAQLADDLMSQRFFVMWMGMIGKQHQKHSFAWAFL